MSAYVDPHIHMVSRMTDDYKPMAVAGCVLVSEPAFWAGLTARAEGFRDYFRQFTGYEPKRAGDYAIAHIAGSVSMPKRPRTSRFSRGDRMIPEFLDWIEGARDRRDRPEQEHAERGDGL